MRTAVVRIGVDPSGQMSADQLRAGMAALVEIAKAGGASLVETELAGLPASRREVELLMMGPDPAELTTSAVSMCAKAFGGIPVPGVVTYISRGTDDDASGVLAGFGITGEIERIAGQDGWDIVDVTLRKKDLERIPESRIHTALEASLNCEVRIRTR
ncbi:hypothetical protein [Mycolicibacterium mengxianglii]|uniref:hypothetical protein n=1 Tax=Mycolicibacterium mengxianglii TaxID=2736649 RepID=UPI0018D12537|nr:hypothetical protein [Mycolicibacterium mengxianglii]